MYLRNEMSFKMRHYALLHGFEGDIPEYLPKATEKPWSKDHKAFS